ncbi:PepSY domain-containing protein [Alteraurantiacibacter palmitatis]|uniref:PepSY domain-containing protein n=1 Tax=Alteraurantiacibacter palmitatis TaxID=2054628 RepID=A0ABV7E304_9SPHN
MRLLALAAAIALPTAALANDWDDQPITDAERASVMAALEAAGCTSPDSIERDDNGYDVDNARCGDGVYDIELDRDFTITERDRED